MIVQPSLDVVTPLIADFEAFRASPYLDGASVPTIGFGTTHYPSGLAVTMADATISVERAEIYLQYDLHNTAGTLWRIIAGQTASRQPTLNQWSAMLSIGYNEGAHAIACSTLMRMYLAGQYEAAAQQFLVWDKIHRDGALVFCQGLLNRRQKERALFLKPDGGV